VMCVQTAGYQCGLVLKNEHPIKVREGGEDAEWRPFHRPDWTFQRLIKWLIDHKYVVDLAHPPVTASAHDPKRINVRQGPAVRTYWYKRVE